MNHRPFRAALLLLILPVVAACATGANPPIQDVQPHYPAGDVGPVAVRSLVILSAPQASYGAAVVTLVNTGDEPQTLQSLQIAPSGATTGQRLDVQAGITVPARGAVNVGAAGEPSLRIDDLSQVATQGFVTVTMIFDKAGQITLSALIQEATGPFASFLPTPAQRTATPSPTGSVMPSPSPSPTPTPTG